MIKATAVAAVLAVIVASAALRAEQIMIEQVARYDDETSSFSVDGVYEVKAGDILIIPAGTKLYFAPKAGIDVRGELMITGTYDRQVILASKKSLAGNGEAGDWRGIRLFPGASAAARYAIISNAATGITACCDSVSLSSVAFHTNGANFKLDGKEIKIKEREPISHTKAPAVITAPKTYGGPAEEPKPSPEPAAPKTKPAKKSSTGFWIGMGLDIAGAGIIAYGAYENSNIKTGPNVPISKNKKHKNNRDTAYIAGAAVLLTGISIQIIF